MASSYNYSTLTLLCMLLITTVLISGSLKLASAKTFTLVNKCNETVWPAIITAGDNLTGEGFELKQGESSHYEAPSGWSGRIWARTGCNFTNGTGSCQTGGCGTDLNCTIPSDPPYTIAQFTIGDTDFYDVSLVDGFNLPIYVAPLNGKGNCSRVGCDGDLRQNCPPQLAVEDDGKVVSCQSACNKFNSDEYCCRGLYADRSLCMPTNYSMSFKQVCPAASTYSMDSSIITCSGAEYVVAFCASR
ncbi:hypothetical protein ACFE04_003074 [Oxalis oulophora]